MELGEQSCSTPTIGTYVVLSSEKRRSSCVQSSLLTRENLLSFTAKQLEELPTLLLGLMPVAMKTTGNLQDAEDLISQVAIRALRTQNKCAPDTNLGGWLYIMMKNIHIDNKRRENLRRFVPVPELWDEAEEEKPEHELSDWLDKALKEVPEKYRKVLELHYSDGLFYAEIAEKLEIPVGTVMSRLHRGLKVLRKLAEDVPKP